MMPIELHHLAKAYRPGWGRRPIAVLRGIDLTVPPGECFGYLGANGAGKTTTLKILVGLLRPTAGEAHLWGIPVGDPLARRRVGFVPEEPALPLRLSPRELLDYGARLCRLSARQRRERREELIARLGLESCARAPLRRLSKGQRQRAALAQALVGDPDLLLLDEPLTGLDALGRSEVMALLAGLHREGKTIFLSSHLLSDVERLCDRVGILRDGELATVGKPGDLVRSNGSAGTSLEEAFVALVTSRGAARGPRQEIPEEESAASRELVGV